MLSTETGALLNHIEFLVKKLLLNRLAGVSVFMIDQMRRRRRSSGREKVICVGRDSNAEIEKQAGAAHDFFEQTFDFFRGMEKSFIDLAADLMITLAVVGLQNETVRYFEQGYMEVVFMQFQFFAGLFQNRQDFAISGLAFLAFRAGACPPGLVSAGQARAAFSQT